MPRTLTPVVLRTHEAGIVKLWRLCCRLADQPHEKFQGAAWVKWTIEVKGEERGGRAVRNVRKEDTARTECQPRCAPRLRALKSQSLAAPGRQR